MDRSIGEAEELESRTISLGAVSTLAANFSLYCPAHVMSSFMTREVVIRLSLSYSAHGYAPFDATLPDTLATILLQMSRVEKLTIDIDKSRVRLFEDAFKKHKAILPSIRRFALWRYRVGILEMCPNVTSIAVHSLSADHLKALMETLPRFSKLEAFHLDNTPYTEEVLDGE